MYLTHYLINGYIGVGNILIGKIPSGCLTGIDLRSTACSYTSRLLRRPVLDDVTPNIRDLTDDIFWGGKLTVGTYVGMAKPSVLVHSGCPLHLPLVWRG